MKIASKLVISLLLSYLGMVGAFNSWTYLDGLGPAKTVGYIGVQCFIFFMCWFVVWFIWEAIEENID